MLNLPKPKLAYVNAIAMSSPELEKSLEYYQKLGFSLFGYIIETMTGSLLSQTYCEII
jgi:hypothetical protein